MGNFLLLLSCYVENMLLVVDERARRDKGGKHPIYWQVTMNESLESLKARLKALGASGSEDAMADVKYVIDQAEKLMRRIDVLERVSRITSSVSRIETEDDVDKVLSDILSNAIELSKAGRGFIVLKDDSDDGFTIRASRMVEGVDDNVADGEVSADGDDMRISRSLIKTILESEKGVVTTNAQQDERFQRSATMMIANIRSVMATPIRLHQEVIGGIYVDSQLADYLFDENDLTALSSFADNAAVTLTLATSLKARRDFNVQSVRALVNAVEAADAYTAGHSSRVGYYARGIAARMALDNEDVENILFAGYLHDVGKIALTLPVSKQGPLNDAEWEEMRKHTIYGVRILEDSPALAHLLPAVRSHHEKWTGGGYPDGIAGEDIHLYARIIAVADAFDAMTTDRPYRKAYETDYALSEVAKGRGTLYYPPAADAFLQAFEHGDLALANKFDKDFFASLELN
jgi:HD-GYP domain-containing protein (c-di-GMP phosphodiesterase class II)